MKIFKYYMVFKINKAVSLVRNYSVLFDLTLTLTIHHPLAERNPLFTIENYHSFFTNKKPEQKCPGFYILFNIPKIT